MISIITFIAGAVVGGVVMVFVYHNNKQKASDVAENIKASYNNIKDDIKSKIDNK